MNKEEIYEQYWRQLVRVRRVYTGTGSRDETMYLYYKRQAEKERDELLKKYGYEPFVSGAS
jgi:hypothetical protein